MEDDRIWKMYFTIQELNGKFTGLILIGGFDTEEEARLYLANYSKNDKHSEILTEIPTIH